MVFRACRRDLVVIVLVLDLGRIPQAADYFEWGGYHYEVVDMDGFRVDKILVLPVPQEDRQAGDQAGV